METILGAGAIAGEAAGAPAPIMDSDTNGFMADVIEASNEVPVIVDFWAAWCGPCKQLTPMLEKVVTQARGAVRLVKIDVDANPELSGQLRIQSIPTVFAFKDGQPVDAFQGALPESQVQSWVDQLVAKHGSVPAPSPVDEAFAAAEAALGAGDYGGAGALYAQVLNVDAGNTRALAGMARCYVAAGKVDKARELLDAAPAEARDSADVKAVATALELAEAGAEAAGQTDELRARVAADEDDHQARYELAVALYGSGDAAAAVDALLTIIARQRDWNDDAARLQLLKIFEALGPTDPLTVEARRRLSSILFS